MKATRDDKEVANTLIGPNPKGTYVSIFQRLKIGY